MAGAFLFVVSGWQPRWFVLVGGTLSYYDSQEDAWKGCKGSIKMSVCEIQVHSSDNTRMDLIIPGEQYFYLKAIKPMGRSNDMFFYLHLELHENTEALKTKMSELRFYCDLLQQVHKIKREFSACSICQENTGTGTLVKSTCGTFLKTLEECMQIASKTFNSELLLQTPPSSPPVAAIKPDKVKYCNPSSHSITERNKELNDNCRKKHHYAAFHNGTPAADSMRGVHDGWVKDCDTHQQDVQHEEEEENVDTFFNTMGHRFTDIKLEDGSCIPTEPFLESCYATVPVLDKLVPTVFAPAKIDFVGNIKKINQKYIGDPENCTTLERFEFLDNAYGKTLRRYHGWVVRGVFVASDQRKAGFPKRMHRDIDVYLPAMEHQLAIVDAMYEEYSLESDELVPCLLPATEPLKMIVVKTGDIRTPALLRASQRDLTQFFLGPVERGVSTSSGTRWYAAASRRKSCCPPKSERGGGTALHSELPPPGGGGAAGIPHAVVSNGHNMSCATASVATTGVPSASATAGVPRADVGITAASATATSRAPSTVATNGVLSAAAGVPNATALPERPQPKRGEPKHPAPERGEAEHPAPERGG
ncbi:pleckstrin homology domain-containing family A member 8-like [Acipenser ruthenus]|uniref:pleckstrin homology domain-containing family A member 8-like n=1 Tax=Acipenser ruthenus TaxID=7906 RepID=UPI002741DFCB|nr:pleckstrin homology domain-containing family A member 8-like [Acipenser ruthenus]